MIKHGAWWQWLAFAGVVAMGLSLSLIWVFADTDPLPITFWVNDAGFGSDYDLTDTVNVAGVDEPIPACSTTILTTNTNAELEPQTKGSEFESPDILVDDQEVADRDTPGINRDDLDEDAVGIDDAEEYDVRDDEVVDEDVSSDDADDNDANSHGADNDDANTDGADNDDANTADAEQDDLKVTGSKETKFETESAVIDKPSNYPEIPLAQTSLVAANTTNLTSTDPPDYDPSDPKCTLRAAIELSNYLGATQPGDYDITIKVNPNWVADPGTTGTWNATGWTQPLWWGANPTAAAASGLTVPASAANGAVVPATAQPVTLTDGTTVPNVWVKIPNSAGDTNRMMTAATTPATPYAAMSDGYGGTTPAATGQGEVGGYFVVSQPVVIDLGFQLTFRSANATDDATTPVLFFLNGSDITLKGLKDSYTSETTLYVGPAANNVIITGGEVAPPNYNPERYLVVRGGSHNTTLSNYVLQQFGNSNSGTDYNAVVLTGSTATYPIAGFTVANVQYVGATVTCGTTPSCGSSGVYQTGQYLTDFTFIANTLSNLNNPGSAAKAVWLNNANISGSVTIQNNQVINPTIGASAPFDLSSATFGTDAMLDISNNTISSTNLQTASAALVNLNAIKLTGNNTANITRNSITNVKTSATIFDLSGASNIAASSTVNITGNASVGATGSASGRILNFNTGTLAGTINFTNNYVENVVTASQVPLFDLAGTTANQISGKLLIQNNTVVGITGTNGGNYGLVLDMPRGTSARLTSTASVVVDSNLFQYNGTSGYNQAIAWTGSQGTTTAAAPLTITGNYFDWRNNTAPILQFNTTGYVAAERNNFGPNSGSQPASSGEESTSGNSVGLFIRWATNQRINTWYPSAVTVAKPDCSVDLTVSAPSSTALTVTTPVQVDVYWTSGDDAEVYLGRYSVNNTGDTRINVPLPESDSAALSRTVGAGTLGSDSLPLDDGAGNPVGQWLAAPPTQVGGGWQSAAAIAGPVVMTTGSNNIVGTVSGGLRLQSVDAKNATSPYSRVVSISGSCAPALTLQQAEQYTVTGSDGLQTTAAQLDPTMTRDLHFTLNSTQPLSPSAITPDLFQGFNADGSLADDSVVTPISSANPIRNGDGTDSGLYTLTDNLQASIVSIQPIYDAPVGTCSNPSDTDQPTCESNGGIWTPPPPDTCAATQSLIPDPADPNSDVDGDGITDTDELSGILNSYNPAATDPADPDSDNDGLSDSEEIGSSDGLVVGLGTNPNSADTDGDGFSDGYEVGQGTDPLDPNSTPTSPDPNAGTNVAVDDDCSTRAGSKFDIVVRLNDTGTVTLSIDPAKLAQISSGNGLPVVDATVKIANVGAAQYQRGSATNNNTTMPSSTWAASPPSGTTNYYQWARQTTTYANGTTITGYWVSATSGTAATVTLWEPDPGTVTYQVGTSATSIPTTWLATLPAVNSNQYLWARAATTINGTTVYAYFVNTTPGASAVMLMPPDTSITYLNPLSPTPPLLGVITGEPDGRTYQIKLRDPVTVTANDGSVLTLTPPTPVNTVNFTSAVSSDGSVPNVAAPQASPLATGLLGIINLSTMSPTLYVGSDDPTAGTCSAVEYLTQAECEAANEAWTLTGLATTTGPITVTAAKAEVPADSRARISNTVASADPNYDGLYLPDVVAGLFATDPRITICRSNNGNATAVCQPGGTGALFQAYIANPPTDFITTDSSTIASTGKSMLPGAKVTAGETVCFVIPVKNISADDWKTELTDVTLGIIDNDADGVPRNSVTDNLLDYTVTPAESANPGLVPALPMPAGDGVTPGWLNQDDGGGRYDEYFWCNAAIVNSQDPFGTPLVSGVSAGTAEVAP